MKVTQYQLAKNVAMAMVAVALLNTMYPGRLNKKESCLFTGIILLLAIAFDLLSHHPDVLDGTIQDKYNALEEQ